MRIGTSIEEARAFLAQIENEDREVFQAFVNEVARVADETVTRADYYDSCYRWLYNWHHRHSRGGGLESLLKGVRKVAGYARCANQVLKGSYRGVIAIKNGEPVFGRKGQRLQIFADRSDAVVIRKNYNQFMRKRHLPYRLRVQKRSTGFNLYRVEIALQGTIGRGAPPEDWQTAEFWDDSRAA